MKINETVTKTFSFSVEDVQLINTALLFEYGKKTIKTAVDNGAYYLPMLSAYAKIAGHISTNGIRFSVEERAALCNLLRNASGHLNEFLQDKCLELLEDIFNNA